MSEADKMFKKLKFEKKENPLMGYTEYCQIGYNHQRGKSEMAVISFDQGSRTIMSALYYDDSFASRGLAITPEELEATYKKCEELGWIK